MMTTSKSIPLASVAIRGALAAVILATCAGRVAGQEVNPSPVAKTPAPGQGTPEISTVEIGGGGVSDGSYKAGEYNGLEKQGGFAIGNIDMRDRTLYDSTNAVRWSLTGNDLGLATRSLHADVRQQGRFRTFFDFDQLLRNRSDSYQTPYSGAGTDTLTLPSNWLVPTVAGSSGTNSFTNLVSARGLVKGIGTAPYIDVRTTSTTQGGLLAPTAAQVTQVNAAANADLASFQNVNLFTKRTDFGGGIDYSLNDQWRVDANIRPEHKDGLKPMGTVSANTGADISTVIPDKIDQDHNQFDTSLNFKGTRGFAQVGYYGSFFTNNVRSMSWQNWATGPTATGAGTVNVMSSAPSNDFNQVNGSAGFKIFSATRFVADGSYGRNTQNQAFLTDVTTPVVPVSSLNGVVVSTLFNAKLTTRLKKKLNLTAAYKFDDRDNQTPVNIYQFADAGALPVVNTNFPASATNPLGPVLAQNANANRAYSTKRNQANFDADYALGSRQWVNGGYHFERIDRACPGSWIDCEDVSTSNENTLRAGWRASVGQDFTARASYDYSTRRGNYNENAFLALVPYANVSPASATGGATAVSFMNANPWNGWGPALGYAATTGNMNLFFPNNNALTNTLYANQNRISELPGLRQYYVADRNRDKLRTSLSWQANESFSVQGGVDLNKDDYPSTVYGLQDAKGWTANADVTYSPSDNFSANLFYTYENLRSISAGETYTANSNASTITNGQPGIVGLTGNACDGYTTLLQRNNNNKIDPCLPWSSNALDGVHTVGAGLRKKQGKLDLVGTVTFARARSDINVTGGNWANNLLDGPGAAPTTFAAVLIAATPYPTVSSNTVELRANGTWAVAKRQFLRVGYSYLYMTSSDWMYQGMELGTGTLSGILPSNEQPFNYKVHAVGLSYLVSF
jgi:MtrB/PioB family decaheme-associated outer membrane protein